MEDTPSKQSNEAVTKKVLHECKICGGPTYYSSFGIIACSSCKMFFKRNAEKKQNSLKCYLNNDCEININNRPICASCRLAKCFSSGMQVELIRASRKPTEESKRKRQIKTTTSNLSARLKEKDQPQQLATLNLLRSDQSTLTIDQWNLLSNITHCFDEYSGFTFAQQFLQEQNQLPLKMRYKLSSVEEYFTEIQSKGLLLYERNNDFLSLPSNDRSILLHKTLKYVAGLGACFIFQYTRALDNQTLYQTAEIIYGSTTLVNWIRTIDRLDSDDTFIKLVLGLLAFSTLDYVYYSDTSSIEIMNIKSILRIQDMYTELIWRYLLYKYGHKRAVISFSNLIRCLFSLNDGVVVASEYRPYQNMVDSLIKQTEQTLTLIQ